MVSQSSASDRRAAANVVNAQKSTGPKTAEGKARSSRNALKHGIFCKQLLLEGEDGEQLKELRREHIRHLNPQTALELAIVERIVQSHWRMARCEAAERAVYVDADRLHFEVRMKTLGETFSPAREERSPTPGQLQSSFGGDVQRQLDGINRYEQRLENTVHRCLRNLERLRQWSSRWSDLPASPYLEEDDEPQTQVEAPPEEATVSATVQPSSDVAECHSSCENEKRTHCDGPERSPESIATAKTPRSEVMRFP